MDQTISTDRRTLLRGAAVAGGVLWATPVVQVIAAPAFAAGTPVPGTGTGLSYVAVLLRAAGVDYLVKFENDGARVEVGTFSTPGCGSFPSTSVTATGTTIDSVVQSHSFTADSFVLVLTSGVELVDWVAKQGTCCMTKSGAFTTGYDVTTTPGTSTYVFPPAPNEPPCSLLTSPSATPVAQTPAPVVVDSSPAASGTTDTGKKDTDEPGG